MKHPRDFLGQPIREGDIICWAMAVGNAPGVSIGRLTKVVWRRRTGPSRYSAGEDCSRSEATFYTLRVMPLMSSGHHYTGAVTKIVTIHKVERVIKLDEAVVVEGHAWRRREGMRGVV